MDDFIIDFLDWFSDWWNDFIEKAWLAVKIIMVVWFTLVTLPLWILPFLYWLIFEKGRDDDG